MNKQIKPTEKPVLLTKENLVSTFLVRALLDKDDQRIKSIVEILMYVHPDDAQWKKEAVRLAMLHSNHALCKLLVDFVTGSTKAKYIEN